MFHQAPVDHTIYILLSIKTRIETAKEKELQKEAYEFISYYPLKQGLKHLILVIHYLHIYYLYPTIH